MEPALSAAVRRPELGGDSILVEFLGLPGVGKSALSHRIGDRLQQRRIPVEQPSRALAHGIGRAARVCRKSGRVALEIVRHPRTSLRAARALIASRQPSVASCAGLLFNWLLVTALARRARRRRGVHLIDEGLAQGAWSIALEGRVESAFELLASLPAGTAPDVTIVVRADLARVAERLRARPEHDSRLDLKLDSHPDLLQRGAAALDRIHEALGRDLRALRVSGLVVVSNERPADLDARAAELAAGLESLARGAIGEDR